jgi:hypothetical protein
MLIVVSGKRRINRPNAAQIQLEHTYGTKNQPKLSSSTTMFLDNWLEKGEFKFNQRF